MAELTLKDGQKKIVSYNTAAKIHTLQNGGIVNEPKDQMDKLKTIAKYVVKIDWKKID